MGLGILHCRELGGYYFKARGIEFAQEYFFFFVSEIMLGKEKKIEQCGLLFICAIQSSFNLGLL